MAISSSNRSPSPMSMRPIPNPNANPNPNPNTRTNQEREGVTPARKSFSGYPLGKPSLVAQPRSFIPNTPANSPAEFAKRSSFSRDHEQKENEGDLPNSKTIVRPRSPSVLKGSKNFMSPTISAASKINPSPRKKVLGERNEAIRTSASLSDGKFQFFSTSLMEFTEDPEKIIAEFSPGEKKVESEPDLVVLSPEVPLKTDAEINVDLDVKNTCCSSPSVIAPLDADPSLPPYDPKTNYLSPRPQFLCYKPNPRIESYINQGLRLEDEFSSESFSDETENTEETQSEKEDSSSSFSEGTSPVKEDTKTHESEDVDELEIEPKTRFSSKWKTVAFGLICLLGFMTVSVTLSPSFGNAMYRDEIVSKVYNDSHVVFDLAKTNFDDVFQKAKLWSADSVGHLSLMIHNLREVNKFSPVQFVNLTGWQEEECVVGGFELSSFVEETTMDTSPKSFAELQGYPETQEEEEDEEEESFVDLDRPMDKSAENSAFLQSDPETEEISEEDTDFSADFEGDFEPTMDSSSQVPEVHIEDLLENDQSCTSDIEIKEMMMEEVKSDISADFEGDFQMDVEPTIDSSSQIPEIHPEEFTSSIEPLLENDHIEMEEMRLEEVKSASEMVLEAIPRSSQLLGSSEITAVSLVALLSLLTVAAAAAYMYMKKPRRENSAVSAPPPLGDQLMTAKKKPLMEKSSWSGPVEVDMMSEPCPSEMSSFQKTPSHSGRRNADEAQSQSHKRDYSNTKRESLASSSSEYTMGSSSYGSFTTYSKISSKRGDEEVVTPVRRSSRLRNHVVSP